MMCPFAVSTAASCCSTVQFLRYLTNLKKVRDSVKVKVNGVQQFARRLTDTGTHVPYGITQYYLPPGRGDIPAFTPAEAGTRLSDPGGMQG